MEVAGVDPVIVRRLRESPARAGRYLLQLSNGRDFVVNAAVLAETGTTQAGVAVSPAGIARIESEAAIIGLMDHALNALASGRRSRRELETRLRRLNVTPEQAGAALDRLEACGWLSDEKMARAEASLLLRKGNAPALVERQMRRKGIDRVTANLAMLAAAEELGADEIDTAVTCRELAGRRARSLRSLDHHIAQRRLTAYLVRRGYDGVLSARIAREVLRTAPEAVDD